MPPLHSFLEQHFQRYQADQPELFKTRLDFAVEVYRQRNLPKEERTERDWRHKNPLQPVGYYLKRGLKPMFVPHPLEVRPCCWAIATPLMEHPHGWHRHCRTVRHVASLANVDERDLRARVVPARDRCEMKCGRFAKKGTRFCSKCAFVHRLDSPESPC